MRSEEEYLKNIRIFKMEGEEHSLKEEGVWECLNKTKSTPSSDRLHLFKQPL